MGGCLRGHCDSFMESTLWFIYLPPVRNTLSPFHFHFFDQHVIFMKRAPDETEAERMEPLKYLFILNPTAGKGKGKAGSKLIPEIMAARKIECEMVQTKAPGHALILAEKAVHDGWPAIIAVGGDGTMGEVINGIMAASGGKSCHFGFIPAGTGNDFARSLQIPLDMREAVEALLTAKTKRIDLGRERDGCFAIITGLGFPADVMARANAYKGILKGPAVITWSVLKTIHELRAEAIELILDGEKQDMLAKAVFVLNMPFTGGGLQIVPYASPDDGFLEKVRTLATEKGIALVFDECTSGFRQTFGGLHKLYGVEPDMAVFGKALGNGYAITAVIGRREIMEAAQSTFISSTFWTERIGPSAALKTLEVMERIKSWEQITQTGIEITSKCKALAEKHGLSIAISGLPALMNFTFNSPNALAYKTLITQEMLTKGYLAGTSVYVCTEHTPEIVGPYFEALDPVFALIRECEDGRDVVPLLKGPVCHSGFKRLN